MENKKNLIIFAAIFAAIAGFSAWYIYRDYVKSSVFDNSSPENKNQEPSISVEPATPAMSADEIKKKMPDLDKEIVINADLSEKDKDTAVNKIKEIITRLKANYDIREDWLNLGIWRKMLGDYEGAKEAWEFVTLIRPDDPVAYHNLGDLYTQNLANFPLAEKYYLTAIAKDPTTAFFYMKLFEFYRYYLKKPDLAENILVKGVKATNDSSLEKLLADYRKDIGK